ncbi:MAG: ACT domain-containing protein [Desulfocapsaceae bacterium]
MKLTLTVLEGSYGIHRFAPDAVVPDTIQESLFYSVTRTDEELSIVCDATIDLHAIQSETDWRVIKIVGPLNFSLTGILAAIAEVLAGVKISIFTLSTFDTDYILVRNDNLKKARKVLLEAGNQFL